MTELKIKPLSVNKAWQGKRYKTQTYKKYERDLLFLLPKKIDTWDKMELEIEFGFKSPLSDIDNPVKLLMDILQKKYKFDDRDIYKLVIIKKLVKESYIKFELKEHKQPQQL